MGVWPVSVAQFYLTQQAATTVTTPGWMSEGCPTGLSDRRWELAVFDFIFSMKIKTKGRALTRKNGPFPMKSEVKHPHGPNYSFNKQRPRLLSNQRNC